MTSTNLDAREAAQVQRMVPRLRRVLAEAPRGIARAELRRRLNSREKHLYDAAMGLLLAVGDVAADPAFSGGTRYRLTSSALRSRSEPPTLLREEQSVVPTPDAEAHK